MINNNHRTAHSIIDQKKEANNMPRRNHPKKRKTIYNKGNRQQQETYFDENEYGF